MVLYKEQIRAWTESVKVFFDSVAGDPKWLSLSSQERRFVSKAIAATPVREGDYVLEPGCGAGRVTPLLAEAVGTSGWVLSLDVSPEMIKQARAHHPVERACFVQASVAEIPVEDHSLDAVFCFNCFHQFPCPPLTLQELARVLKPGGRLALAHTESLPELEKTRALALPLRAPKIPSLAELMRMMRLFGFQVRKLPKFDSCFLLVAELG